MESNQERQAVNENEAMKCPKCGGEMIRGSQENLEINFACTRREPQPEVPHTVKVQPYYCKNCGFIELYKEKKA